MTRADAAALAAALELDVDDIAICHACLSFVSFALDSGNEHKVAGSITSMAPDLWAEGLARSRCALRSSARGSAVSRTPKRRSSRSTSRALAVP